MKGLAAPEGSPYLDAVHRLGRHAEKTTGGGVSVRIRIEGELAATLPGMGIAVHDVEPPLRAAMEEPAAAVRASWRKAASPRGRALLDAVVGALAQARRGQ